MDKTTNTMLNKVSYVTITCNTILTIIKFLAGIIGHSSAMVSDAVHSLSDIFTTIVALIGVKFSMKQADKDHPYGHERLECVASLFLSCVLLVVGFGIGYDGIEKIISGNYNNLKAPTTIALIAAIFSIITKEAMFWYTRHYAKLLNSPAFMADAWHHRSDALSSIGSLLGIGAAMLGFPIFDPIASVIICLFIFKVAFDILIDAIKKMLDTSCSEEYEEQLVAHILSQPDVSNIDMIQTRMFGNKIYVDAEIAVDGSLSLREAHEICHAVHDSVEKNFDNIKHIMIHVNPADNEPLSD